MANSRRSQKAGLSPGTLFYLGRERKDDVKIDLMDYSNKKFSEGGFKKIEECFPFKKKKSVTWINIEGVHKPEIIEKVGSYFGIHPLILEDIMSTGQRPKIEDMEDYVFIVLKMLFFEDKTQSIKSEQVSIILGKNFVISFQEGFEGDVFEPLRERIRKNKGTIRKMGTDYLAYSLIDAIVDNYFVILEKFGEGIEKMQETLMRNPNQKTLHEINKMKKDMLNLRKSIWPLRDVISTLQRADSKLFQKSTGIFLRDVYDHTIQVMDTVETYRDMISGMMDTYLSSVSNKMNEVMKVLTIIATIFIPLTFIAGIYGMNFRYMPELGWEFGYPLVWAIIIIIAVLMLIYFKKKKWL